MSAIKLKCACGKVKGITESVNADSGNRIVCCCHDCQAFAQHLGQQDSTLDQYGGTDIFQMPISYVKITEGNEHIASIRLTAKGMHRWHTTCCNTPIGNTLGAGVPFIGLIHNFMDNTSSRDHDLGKVRAYIQTNSAKQAVPADQRGSTFKVILRTISKIISWKFKGLNKPSAFFDDNGKPIAKPNILN